MTVMQGIPVTGCGKETDRHATVNVDPKEPNTIGQTATGGYPFCAKNSLGYPVLLSVIYTGKRTRDPNSGLDIADVKVKCLTTECTSHT